MTNRKRVTVKILTAGDAIERDFHIFEDQVACFVAKIKREGGTARVLPLQLGADLIAMLTRIGVNSAAIK